MNSEKSQPRSERRDAAENRQRILKVAQKLFDQYGVEQVSMNQIASEAQVGPGTLYRRYRNKSELCLDLIRDNIDMLFNDVEDYLGQNHTAPPSQQLKGILSLFICFREKKAQLLAGVEESSPSNPISTWISNPIFGGFHQKFVKLFDEINVTEKTNFNSVFRADMLLITLTGDSYSFQREVRGNSSEMILEQISEIFLSF